MLFQTQRLKIRQLTLDDFEPFFEMQGNPNVMRYVGDKHQNEEECRKDLKGVIDFYQKEKNGFWVWAIERKEDGKLVGTAAIIFEENNKAEIGYRFLEKYWGNGYGLEISNGLIDYGFKEMKIKTIFATVDRLNIGSVKILEKSILKFIKQEWSDQYKSHDRYYELENPFED